MQGLKQALADTVDNRIGDGRSKPSSARCVIWTGRMMTDANSVENCPGYDKLTTSVWVAAKDRFNAFTRGLWRPENLDIEITRIRTRLGLPSDTTNLKEYKARTGPESLQSFVENDPEVGKPTGTRTKREPGTNLWIELAFFELEVKRVELTPHEENRIPGAIINPRTCEVSVQLNSSAKFEPVGAKLILNPLVDRMVLNMVPRGGGIKAEDYNRQVSAKIGRSGSTNSSIRVSRAIENMDWKYRQRCPIQDPEVSLEGDIWNEGVRSSITRGLFEVWTDDLRMGPMLKISRQTVQEASARYKRDTAAAQQRYASERDHPGGGEIASSGLTPVTTYIEDWFGDPNLYLGLAQFLIQLSQGFDEDSGSNEINKKTVDLGVFDYGKIYKKYEGVEV